MDYGKHLFNDEWYFLKLSAGSTAEDAVKQKERFCSVSLPHDWLIYQVQDLYESSFGCYRKTFVWAGEPDQRAELRFDGIYMDSTVYVNGREAGQWKYGYSAFTLDLTPWLRAGENELLVTVNYLAPNSRWYSGAGIYRDVWLKVTHQAYIPWDGIYVSSREEAKDTWLLHLETEVYAKRPLRLEYILRERRAGKPPLVLGESPVPAGAGLQKITYQTRLAKPARWDVSDPVCHDLYVRLRAADSGAILQEERLTLGFRSLSFQPDEGFRLNGRRLKLQGVCEHHDLGCLGAAYHPDAMRRKMEKLKAMGVNALRFAHNMAAEDALELADELGLLLLSEGFDMWERPKTKYDYARFFPEWYKRDVASWIRRDRNHPCVIMWSIGNEIYETQAGARGQELTGLFLKEVRRHDPRENAPVTLCSNYMSSEKAQQCADLLGLAGYNYAERLYAADHAKHPERTIFGSETGSVVQSRGIYHFPYRQSVLADADRQCSALGNASTSWGAKSAEACILAERDCSFSCGQFIWSGFDYIGEPTPYHTKNSYFGQLDTAGFPKDSFYIYQAAWQKDGRAKLHLFPHWDFNEGQLIDVRAATNAAAAELFLNGRSCGRVFLDHARGTELTAHWQVPYEKGVIRAFAYDDEGRVIAEAERSSFGEAVRLRLQAEKTVMKNAGRELNFVSVWAEDAAGRPVENANNRVTVELRQNAVLLGLDNGDSTDEDEYKTDTKRLFSGKLLIVLAAAEAEDEVIIKVTSPGLEAAVLTLPVQAAADGTAEGRGCLEGMRVGGGADPRAALRAAEAGTRAAAAEQSAKKRTSVSAAAADETRLPAQRDRECSGLPVRNIYLYSSAGTLLDPEQAETEVRAEICPASAADRALTWEVVNDAGIPLDIAVIEAEGSRARLRAKSDGRFRLRCLSKAGTAHTRIISSLEFEIRGFGQAFKNPYRFISAGLRDYVIGEIGNGNEHGIASSPHGLSGAGFHGLDFGPEGTEAITLPIFALSDAPYRIRIYEGMADQADARLLADVIYQKPSRWNVYQEETYKLSERLRGVKDISFLFEQKVHLKGFVFTESLRAFRPIRADACDLIYGDSYQIAEGRISGIGNNVSLLFRGLNFGEAGCGGISLRGYTAKPDNLIRIRLSQPDGSAEMTREISFRHQAGEAWQTFRFARIRGTWDVTFVFLPGSDFNFKDFYFTA